jgi:hypothetical protein
VLITSATTVDETLERHAVALGRDATPYRHHVYRVLNFCVALSSSRDPEALEKMAVAAVFHDLGIWTARTFDYLQPSIALARAHLVSVGRGEWIDEVGTMVLEHHKASRYGEGGASLVEAFRRADWIDVSRGVLTFGVPRPTLGAVFARWPNAGFHRRLLQLAVARLVRHPFTPLPMLRR